VREKLPLWRLIAGLSVLCGLLLVAAAIAPLYVQDYRFAGYVRDLAARSDTAAVPDDRLKYQISAQAKLMGLPIEREDVTVRHVGGRVQLQVARFKAHLMHADLHFPVIETK